MVYLRPYLTLGVFVMVYLRPYLTVELYHGPTEAVSDSRNLLPWSI